MKEFQQMTFNRQLYITSNKFNQSTLILYVHQNETRKKTNKKYNISSQLYQNNTNTELKQTYNVICTLDSHVSNRGLAD